MEDAIVDDHDNPPTLVLIRRNSGSGKTTAAREVRRRYGPGCALLEQHYLRRILLREHDSSQINPVAPAFIAATARTARDLGCILHSDRYGATLHQLIDSHTGPTYTYYIDVSFEETDRRHHRRAQPVSFTAEQMRYWYTHKDLLDVPGERLIGQASTFETVSAIRHTRGLATGGRSNSVPKTLPRGATDP